MVCCASPIAATKVRSFLFYFSPDSPCQKINPLTKLITVLIVGTVAFIIENIYANLILLVIVCIGLAMARISSRFFKMALIGISGLLLVSTVAHALFSQIPGESVYLVFPWGTYITERTIHFVVIVYLRFLAASLITLIFLCTTRETDVVTALRFLRLPYAVCFVCSLSLRFISILVDDWWSIVQAQRARGMEFKGTLIARLKKLLGLSLPMITSAFRKINDSNHAILARGFTLSNVRRTQIRQLRWSTPDYILLTLLTILLMAVIIAKYYGYLTFV